MLKHQFRNILICLMVVALAACGGNKEAETLIAQSERVNGELQAAVQANPGLMSRASASYADSAFNVDVVFADSIINVADLSQPLVEYFLSERIKASAGKNLDDIVNALARLSQPLRLSLTDVYGATRSYDLSAATLKTLYRTPRSQLNINEVKQQVISILADQSFRLVTPGVQKVDFSLANGFATYTIVYDNAHSYSGLTVGNLKARYLKVLKPRYAAFGILSTDIIDMDKSLGIDGYRFVLTTPAGNSEIKSTLPWREIN